MCIPVVTKGIGRALNTVLYGVKELYQNNKHEGHISIAAWLLCAGRGGCGRWGRGGTASSFFLCAN